MHLHEEFKEYSDMWDTLNEWVDKNGNNVPVNKTTKQTTTSNSTSSNKNLIDHYKELVRQILECAHKVINHDLWIAPNGNSFELALYLSDRGYISLSFYIPTKEWTFKYDWYSDTVDDCKGKGFFDLLAKLHAHRITDRICVWEYSNPDFIHEFRKYE